MLQVAIDKQFQPINQAYNSVFRPNRLSVGLVVPLENYASGPVPTMQHQIKRVQMAEALGFPAIWLRDVPFNVPSFGDAGQVYDPFVYLGFLAANTSQIALGVASIVLPLRHPAHVAKAAASVDELSGGRLLLGVASGDRPEEYPAMEVPFHERGKKFRDSYDYIRRMGEDRPVFEGLYDSLNGLDMLPKPVAGKLPLLITCGCQQSKDWLANNGDGWMTYPRDLKAQSSIISDWRERTISANGVDKPVMQPLYVDITKPGVALPRPIHLGVRCDLSYLRDHLLALQEIGVNHVALNLRFNQMNIESTMEKIAANILPEFSG